MDIRKIKKLIEMLQDSDLTEIEVTEGEEAVRISRNSGNIQSVRETLSQPTEHSEQISVSKNDNKSEDVGKKITSPIVGTFYRKPGPDKDPYIREGDRIEAGQVVCIVEAMKIMNEIESNCSGTITEILVSNGTPVEYGQPLFSISKD